MNTRSVLLLLALCAAASPALAQTPLPCSTACPFRYYFESQPCAAGLCERGYAPLPAEFAAPLNKGMSLQTMEAVDVVVCASPGFALLGTGSLELWTWEPWLPNDVMGAPEFELLFADADPGESCSYTTLPDGTVVSGVGAGPGGSNLSYPCRCARWSDRKVGGLSDRRVLLRAKRVGVTGGTSLEVRLVGLGRL